MSLAGVFCSWVIPNTQDCRGIKIFLAGGGGGTIIWADNNIFKQGSQFLTEILSRQAKRIRKNERKVPQMLITFPGGGGGGGGGTTIYNA